VCDALTDVAQNAHDLRVQQVYGRSIINSLHVGAVLGTIAGFAAAGLGAATVVPAAFHGADLLPGLRTGTGLAVGVVADATDLRAGLVIVPITGLAIAAAAGVLSGRSQPTRS
jgi:hypothetical protein